MVLNDYFGSNVKISSIITYYGLGIVKFHGFKLKFFMSNNSCRAIIST